MACVCEAGRHQQGEEPAGSWSGQLCLLHSFSTHSWLSFLLEPFGTIRANIRVKPPGTKMLLTTGAAVPVPSGTHFNSGVTQLQTFLNPFGCCHPALLGIPPLPSEAPPLVFAFTSCSSAGTIVHTCCSPMYNYKDEAILRKTNL